MDDARIGTGRRRLRLARWAGGAVAAVVLGAVAAPPALAADGSPCGPVGSAAWSPHPVQLCPLTSPEAGNRIPVYSTPVARPAGAPLPTPQGWLHGTANQRFVCQVNVPNARFHHARGWWNTWWAYTASDSGVDWGYVPQVYFAGGDNGEPDAGLRHCPGSSPPPEQPKPEPKPKEPPRCGTRTYRRMRINEDQRIKIKASGLLHRYREITRTTPPERHTHIKRRFKAGSTTLHLATCKRPGHRWNLLRAGNESIRVDHPRKLHELEDHEMWMGFAVRKIQPRFDALRGSRDQLGRVHIEGIVCRRNPGPWLLQALVSFPIPGASYAFSIGQFLVGSLIPTDGETKCGRAGRSWATLYVDKRSGDLSVDGFTTSHYLSRDPEPQDSFFLVQSVTIKGQQVR